MEHLTAKISCFARAYHYRNNQTWVFQDPAAELLLGETEYQAIAQHMSQGISFFAPGFQGSQEEALELIVDQQLSPSVLGRSAFAEDHLRQELALGCRQYVLFAGGYDTFALRERTPGLQVFELDLPDLIADKRRRVQEHGLSYQTQDHLIPCDLSHPGWQIRLQNHGFSSGQKTFGSLLGLSYYLEKSEFSALLSGISGLWQAGSAICFDYPALAAEEASCKTEKLAAGAGERMKARYRYGELERLLESHGFLIYAHLDEKEMTEQYFFRYNRMEGNHLAAPKGVRYMLAVKQE